ncbi:MAG TPA: M28 family peptidase [Solirubrobacteraceae bacterium]|nr:M28 family peptidase [Solirubrobacteraceae bacterium]
MRLTETVSGLAAFPGRGAGTDAERRSARWLASELSANGGEVVVEPFWTRPNWALANAWHVALAIAGSLVSVPSPIAGCATLGLALVFVLADALTGVSPGRRLTRERASQNVIAVAPSAPGASTRLILTANYDAGRSGLAYRDIFRRTSSFLRQAVHGIPPGWVGWLVVAILWLLAVAVLRLDSDKGQVIGAIQLPPTVALVLAFAMLLELGTADWSPAAGDNASGVAVAVALARALGAAPPAHLAVELVLTGAGDGGQLGLRRYLRAHRAEQSRADTVVLGVAPCTDGRPRWWRSDGAFLPLRYARPLRQLAERVAGEEPHLAIAPHVARGAAPAFPARRARLPALAIGCLDDRGLAPRSHHRDDTADAVDASALDAAVQFGLLLIDGIDAVVADAQGQPSATPA